MMKYKKSVGDVVFRIFLILFMALVVIVTLYPLWYILVGSFNEGIDFMRGGCISIRENSRLKITASFSRTNR